MYEKYTRQPLPSKRYRKLLGSAICVFNSNNSFIIENILKNDDNKYSWHKLMDKTSGRLKPIINEVITAHSNSQIADLFSQIVDKRNRIIHSFQFTDKDGEQRLATKEKNNNQYIITEDHLLGFIKENERLSTLLHSFRGY